MPDKPHDLEQQNRIIYSLLVAAVRLAKVFGVPLKRVTEMAQLAYFRELRQDGLQIDEIAKALDISGRSAARLSKQVKANFFRPEQVHDVPRRIEFMLWAEPIGLGRIKAEMKDVDPDEIEAALQMLIDEGRVEEQAPSAARRIVTYRAKRPADRLVSDDWLKRVGSLNTLVSNVAAVTWSRFVGGDEFAAARNLLLHVRPEDMPKLRQLYEEQVWPFLRDLDSDAANREDAESVAVTVIWSKHDPIPPGGGGPS